MGGCGSVISHSLYMIVFVCGLYRYDHVLDKITGAMSDNTTAFVEYLDMTQKLFVIAVPNAHVLRYTPSGLSGIRSQ